MLKVKELAFLSGEKNHTKIGCSYAAVGLLNYFI